MTNDKKLEIIKKLNISNIIENSLQQYDSGETIQTVCEIIKDMGIFIIDYKKEFKNLNSISQEGQIVYVLICFLINRTAWQI